MPYVRSRWVKLAVKPLKVFNIDLEDKTVLDIGASTGGFTDVALQNGAKMSYPLNVGYNQLAWKLREDPRVKVMERVNFRYSKPEDFTDGPVEFAMTDVSFISLKLIFATVKSNSDSPVVMRCPSLSRNLRQGPANVRQTPELFSDPQVHRDVLK